MSEAATIESGGDAATATDTGTTIETGGDLDTGQVTLTEANDAGGQVNPYANLINPDGTFKEGWVNDLTDDRFSEYRATAANYKDLPSLLKGLKESKSAAMQRLDGMVKVPGEGATEEDIAAFRKGLGVPESPDGYEIKIDGLPEGIELDEGLASEFKKLAHENNLTPAQVNRLAAFQVQTEARMREAQQAEQEAYLSEQRKTLESEWGNDFQKNMSLAQRTAATFGLEQDHPVFNHADMVQALAKIGNAISEDRLVSGESMSNKLNPEHQAEDIMTNPDNALYQAYRNPAHPDHQHAVGQVNKLMKKAYPS